MAVATTAYCNAFFAIIIVLSYCPAARWRPVMTSSPGYEAHHAVTFATFLSYTSRLM
jgi:hypothetical protein